MTPLGAVDLRRLLEGTTDGACAMLGTGGLALWNAAAERLLGWRAVDVLGRPCHEVMAGCQSDGTPLCAAGCRVLRAPGRAAGVPAFDMRTTTRDGRTVWLNVSVLAAPGSGSEPCVVVHLFRELRPPQDREETTERDGAAAALTRRELEILRLVATGLRTRAIAARLGRSPATVRNHVQSVFSKLGVHNRLEAVAHALRLGLVPGPRAVGPRPEPPEVRRER